MYIFKYLNVQTGTTYISSKGSAQSALFDRTWVFYLLLSLFSYTFVQRSCAIKL